MAFQSSQPWIGSQARKKSLPATFVRLLGKTNFVSTSFVPAPVPSELQSFVPAWAPSLPAKKSVPATSVSQLGLEVAVPGLISRSGIPAAVPSVLRAPGRGRLGGGEEEDPATFVRNSGFELAGPGLSPLRRYVPAQVPLDFQSSLPCGTSLAAKKSFPATAVRWNGAESSSRA